MNLFDQVQEIESSDFPVAINIYEEAFPVRERATTWFFVDKISDKLDATLLELSILLSFYSKSTRNWGSMSRMESRTLG